MPKERFHIYLADQLVKGGEIRPPVLFDIPAFFIGAVSPDIFYYDPPFFSLSALGDWLHSLIERDGIATIYDWISKKPFEEANAEAISWALGVACHFMADALWHPLIEELSDGGLDGIYSGSQRLTPVERHRLIESEIEAFWLAKSCEAKKIDYLPSDFGGKRGRLLEIASHYRRFLEFAGAAAPARFSTAPAPLAGLSERRIVRCFLWQNFLLRLFANRTAGGGRDLLLSFPPTRFVGALVDPVRPFLPALFARRVPEESNPFSDSFMNRALSSFKTDWRVLIEQIEAKAPK